MNKQELANKIWQSANTMRSKIEANEYKDYILGFIFYKFLSDKVIRFVGSKHMTKEQMKEELKEEKIENVEFIQQNLGYFISYDNLFSTWIERGSSFSVSDVRDALSAFNRLIDKNYKKLFEGIFDTLETGLSKLGTTTQQQTKAIRDLLQLIKDVPTDNSQEYDVLGYIYEYLIKQFASNAGKKAGEFYTPSEVSILMSEIIAEHLKNEEKIEIYDSTSGSGSLLINIGKSASKHMKNKDNIKYFAQELKQNTYNLTRMNLIMRDILPANIVTRNADTLEEDWPYFDENDPLNTYNPLYVNAVVSNPPYSQAWNPENRENDPRYSRFGIAPKSKADYAFLLHDLFHLKPNGIMTIVLPHGVLFRGGEEAKIRKNLIESNHIDAIIGLPANIFYGTGIPTIIMVLKQKRENRDILIIDGSKGYIKEDKNNVLRASDIRRISDAIKYRTETPKFSKRVSLEEIRQNEYNLNIPRYVDSSEEPETYDIYSLMFGGIPKQEVESFAKYWQEFPNMKKDIFKEISGSHYELEKEDFEEDLKNHKDIIMFKEKYQKAFEGFSSMMDKELIENLEDLNINKTKDDITNEIFKRMKNIELIDPYAAYQILDNNWEEISKDIEVIQTEGREVLTKVVPNIITKTKNNVEIDEQDGWVGKIIPFTLIKETLLKDENNEIKELENRLENIINEQNDILENFSEEEKEDMKDFLNTDNTKFTAGGLKQLLNTFKEEKYDEESLEGRVLKYKKLNDEEKVVRKEVKDKILILDKKIKETIESLSDEEATELLKRKWITPIIEQIFELPNETINNFVDKINKLSKKYETTFQDIEDEIKSTEKELMKYIDDLTGSETDMKGLNEFKLLLGGNQ